eukprot:scaffold63421_cov26-Tisochrysis_lutea.AAC.2
METRHVQHEGVMPGSMHWAIGPWLDSIGEDNSLHLHTVTTLVPGKIHALRPNGSCNGPQLTVDEAYHIRHGNTRPH